ncbi:MAG: hypothetical protein WC943_16515 [Elusimicrobiota bacterium]|jgi:hypothetical protein
MNASRKWTVLTVVAAILSMAGGKSFGMDWDGSESKADEKPVLEGLLSSARGFGEKVAARPPAVELEVDPVVLAVSPRSSSGACDPSRPGLKSVAHVVSAEPCWWRMYIEGERGSWGNPAVHEYTCLKLNLSDGTSRRIVFDYSVPGGVYQDGAANQRRAAALKRFVEHPATGGRYQLVVPDLADSRISGRQDRDRRRHEGFDVNWLWSTEHPTLVTFYNSYSVAQEAPNDAFFARQLKVCDAQAGAMLAIEKVLDSLSAK